MLVHGCFYKVISLKATFPMTDIKVFIVSSLSKNDSYLAVILIICLLKSMQYVNSDLLIGIQDSKALCQWALSLCPWEDEATFRCISPYMTSVYDTSDIIHHSSAFILHMTCSRLLFHCHWLCREKSSSDATKGLWKSSYSNPTTSITLWPAIWFWSL